MLDQSSGKSEILCVIPARAGSKGLPGKNIVDFAGKPLLAWSIEAALAAPAVGQVIVSTESDEIAAIARAWGAETPFVRPEDLAQDHVHAVHSVLHALRWHEEVNGYLPRGAMMLLPTSPLRRARHVQEAAEMFLAERASAVIGVVNLGKHMTNLRHLHGDRLERVAPEISPNQQRQGAAPLFGVSGAMFLARTDLLIAQETFHLDGALGYVMNVQSAIDVNLLEDLHLARWLQRADWSDAVLCTDSSTS